MSFPRESSKFNYFWIPDQVRDDGKGTFYGTIKFDASVKSNNPEACTRYIAVDPPQYYYIWCINRPMRAFYETIKFRRSADSGFTSPLRGIHNPRRFHRER